MSKDPAFLFYPGDFTTGTQFFTDEQVGKYIRLLMAQHQLGHLEEKHMLFICKTYDKDIFSKFIQDNDKKYYNERLENETIKRKRYSESRSKNRRVEKNICSSYDNHMENRNINKEVLSNENNDSLWNEHLKNFNNDFRWKEKFCRDKSVSIYILESRMNEFIKEIELREDYKNTKELKSHFVNWFNKNQGLFPINNLSNKQHSAPPLKNARDL